MRTCDSKWTFISCFNMAPSNAIVKIEVFDNYRKYALIANNTITIPLSYDKVIIVHNSVFTISQ